MNKTSKFAFEIAQDIYALGGDIDKLNEEYDNHHISQQVYFKNLYIHACEATFLDYVVNVMKNQGYKFARYEKELLLLQSILNDINSTLNLEDINSLNKLDMQRLVQFTKKYKDYVSGDDFQDDLMV